MKEYLKLYLILVFLANYNIILGQTTAANNNAVANRFLGYNAGGFDLQFRTDNLTRMTLTQTTGRLGLGIAAPTSIFHINTSTIGDVFKSDGPVGIDNR
jgi:hypothetical protein